MDSAIKIGLLVGVVAGVLVSTLAVTTAGMTPSSSGMMPGMMGGGSMMGMDADEMRAMHEECLEAMERHHEEHHNATEPAGGG